MGFGGLLNIWLESKPKALLGVWVLVLLVAVVPAGANTPDDQKSDVTKPQADDPQIIDDSTLHPGVASAWVVGHHILASGDVEEAISYLNYAYRIMPEVVLIALDYQEALARGGFIQDAVKVMDKLIAAHPDSLDWRVRRSSLNLRLGQSRKALDDLEALREKGHSSPQLLETEALILASKGDNGGAMDVYRSGLVTFPDHKAEIYMGMIQIHQHTGDGPSIIKICDEALAVLPLEPVFHEMKLRAYVSLGQHKNADKAANTADEQLLATGIVEASFLFQLADIYVQGGQISHAIEVLSKEDETNGLDLRPSLWLARLLLGSNQVEATSTLVQKIEKKWPTSARLWFIKGKLAEERGQWDMAVQHYEQAVVYEDNDPEILLALVRSILVTNDVELALPDNAAKDQDMLENLTRHTQAAAAVAPDADAEGQLVLGYAYRGLLQFDQAIPHFKMAAKEPGFRKTALTQASICYDELGNTENALKILQELYMEMPKDPEVANSLGYFLAEKNMDIKKAEKMVDFALEKEPGRGAFLDSKGWIYYRQGNLDDAFDYLIRAVNVLPDDPVILEHLAIVLHEQGQLEQALDVLQRALHAGGDAKHLDALIQEIEKQVSTSRK